MDRSYYIGNQQIQLEELDDALAIRPTRDLRARVGSAAAPQFGEPMRADVPDPALALEGRDTFETAGWVFIRPFQDIVNAFAARASINHASAAGNIYRMTNGQLIVGTDSLIVKVDEALSPDDARTLLLNENIRLNRELRFAPNMFMATPRANENTFDTADRLRQHASVLTAEPRFIEVIRARALPTDPEYNRQWQWHNNGSNGGRPHADASLEGAWDRTFGNGVKIAVVDNGFDIQHPDLKSGIRRAAYFDDDGIGNADLVVHPGSGVYPRGDHGTFCAGMAGARHNNHEGGCGAAPLSDLILVACLIDQVGSQETLARAIAYAADPSLEDNTASATDGADIIACSLGPNGADWQMQTVLRDAISNVTQSGRGGKGTPIFWAVSNGEFDVGRDEVSSHPDVIAVGRSNRMDLEDGSAFGSELDFLAPGANVYSTEQGGGYGIQTGTSYAAPAAAGVGALVLARNPDFTRDEVRDRLRDTCDKIGPDPYDNGGVGRNDRYGFGRINADAAVP